MLAEFFDFAPKQWAESHFGPSVSHSQRLLSAPTVTSGLSAALNFLLCGEEISDGAARL